MVGERVIQAVAICLPVFAVIGIGIWLRRSGRLRDEHQAFITWFINTVCLPSLIFVKVASYDYWEGPFPWPMLVASIGGGTVGMLVIAAAVGLAARRTGLPTAVVGPLVFTTFWGNYTYLGLPLAAGAFDGGMRLASLVNGVAMPVCVVVGIMVIQFCRRGAADLRAVGGALLKGISNPIVLAAVGGVGAALVLHRPCMVAWAADPGPARAGAVAILNVGRRLLELLGQAGLPLALVCIGHGLRWRSAGGHPAALAFAVSAKLVLAPALTLALYWFLTGSVSGPECVVAVILAGVPTAVASYVIGRPLGMDGPFVAAHLTLSTALSCVTLPVWLFLLM